MISVALADDQPLVRAGLRMILQTEADIDVVGEAADGLEVIEVCTTRQVDVVLMDVRMPDMDGIEATRQLMTIQQPPKVLVLTTFDLDDIVYNALRAGASGFLLKDASEERLTTAIRIVAEGGALFAPAVTRRLVQEFSARSPHRHDPDLAALTDRETEVLCQIARGQTHAEIAATLFVTENTVKTHVAPVLTKLGLRDRGASRDHRLRVRSGHHWRLRPPTGESGHPQTSAATNHERIPSPQTPSPIRGRTQPAAVHCRACQGPAGRAHDPVCRRSDRIASPSCGTRTNARNQWC